MYQKNTSKKNRIARLHEKVVNARGRGLPGKLAEVGALCVAIGAGIWAAQHGRMIIGSAVVMFILYSIILQIVSRLVFIAISLITLPAYHLFIKHQNNAWRQTWGSEEFFFRSNHQNDEEETTYNNHSDFEQNRQHKNHKHDDVSSSNLDMAEDKARALLGLDGSFTIEKLKEARNEALKKWHPDQNITGDQTEVYEEMTKKINEAYKILEKRAQEKRTA